MKPSSETVQEVIDVQHLKSAHDDRWLYEVALSNTPDLVYIFDLNQCFIYANPALLTMWGKTREEALGKNCLELGYEPWHAEMHGREIKEVIRTKKPIRGDVAFTGTLGRKIYDYIFSPVIGDHGEVIAIAGTTRDVTERKEIEEALRISEDSREMALNASEFIGTFDWDIQTNLMVSDERLAKLYLVDSKWAAKGAPLEEYIRNIHPDDLVSVTSAVEYTVRHGGEYAKEYRLVQADTSIRWVIARGRINGNHFTGAVVDITERKRAEEKTEKQRRMFETILENSADFNYIFDTDGRFKYMNKTLANLLEIPSDEAVGKNFFDLGYPIELAARLQNQIQQVIEIKEPVRDETPYTSASGTRAYEYIFSPVLGENGTVEAVAGSTRDITDYKEANRRKDEFLAMLAHELRNPLAPISNSIHILKSSSISDTIRQEVAMLVDRQIIQMTHLLDDLLDISRVTQGKIALQFQKIALVDSINLAMESTAPLRQRKQQTISMDIPANPVWMYADKTRMAQVFSNLLNNSVKYTQEGGKIHIEAFEDTLGIVVKISDNGIGIPKEMQPHIFDLFSQVDSSMERSHGGLGIGLTLVKNLIEMHKGTVSVHSDGKDKGALFTVRLPRQNIMQEKTMEIAVPPHSDQTTTIYRVLIVDDNEASAKTMGWTLEMLGHDIQLAYNGAEAITLAQSYKPDIVLLDIGLPGMNGYEVCQAFRKLPELQHCIIIAQTGWGQKEHKQRSREAGFDFHLVKPIRMEMLQEVLDSVKQR